MPFSVLSTTTCASSVSPCSSATFFGITRQAELWPDVQIFVTSFEFTMSIWKGSYLLSTKRPKNFLEEEYLEQFDGLDWTQLVYHERWLIVLIVCFYYYKTRHVPVGFNQLKVKCNEAIRALGEALGKQEIMFIPDSTFQSIIYSDRCKKYLKIKQIKVESKKGTLVKRTQLVPNSEKIEQEVKARKIENLTYNDKSITYRNKYRHIHCDMPEISEFVKVLDKLSNPVVRRASENNK